MAEGGGLLILPALFVLTEFHVFCLHYRTLICAETPHLRPRVQQESSRFFPSRASRHHDGAHDTGGRN